MHARRRALAWALPLLAAGLGGGPALRAGEGDAPTPAPAPAPARTALVELFTSQG